MHDEEEWKRIKENGREKEESKAADNKQGIRYLMLLFKYKSIEKCKKIGENE